MSTLIELNALRVANNMNPLKAWKESKAKLAAAIAKLTGVPVDQAKQVEVTKVPAGMTAKKVEAQAAKAAKPAKKTKAAKAAKPAKAPKEKKIIDGVTLATIAADLDMNPKVARAKLRRAFGDADGTGSKEGRWVFTKEKATEIKALLKGDARKKKD